MTDSMPMTGAYGWALANPIRKLWYDLTITTASATIALFIGGAGALSLIDDHLPLALLVAFEHPNMSRSPWLHGYLSPGARRIKVRFLLTETYMWVESVQAGG